MIKQICKFNHKALKTKCAPVVEFDDSLPQLITDMIETMKANNGIGLAAPQIGITKRIIVVTDIKTNVVFGVINPEIIYSLGSEIATEGCLSYPGIHKQIRRPTHIKVTGFNEKGQQVEYDVHGLQARIFCHEIDHLNGLCKVSSKKKVA